MRRREFLAGAGTAAIAPIAGSARTPSARSTPEFDIAFTDGRLTRLRLAGDGTDYLAPNGMLGPVAVTLRRWRAEWRRMGAQDERDALSSRPAPTRWKRTATLHIDTIPVAELASGFTLHDEALIWTIRIENLLDEALEIGDFAIPLPMNSNFSGDEPLTSFVLKHSFVSGAGSFIYWMRADSARPFLLMTPLEGTGFEYWDHQPGQPFRAFVHSWAEREIVDQHHGTWRLPATGTLLAPRSIAGHVAEFGVRFTWVDGHLGVRDDLAAHALPDIEIAPGMTIPTSWDVEIAIRSSNRAESLLAEHPDETAITDLGTINGRRRFRVCFAKLGENRLDLAQANGARTYLEFFVTEPLEILVTKRAAFIAAHQHRDPAKWYYGLLAEWNASTGVMLGPDDYDRISGWRIYEVTCDDPGLSKPAFLATKNAIAPVQAEVEALDLYIEHFVWGGLQRTTGETYPYGIYGILDWKANRESSDPGPKGRQHIWRPYDYPHIACLYFSMWRIARDHPEIRLRLPAQTYLDRAAGTAIAMFTVPDAVTGWSAYETGFYNECIIPEIIDALDQNGRPGPAALLRGHWERKVDFFVNGRPNLFGSEYAFDSTGFESTQAIASYALDHAGGSGPLTVDYAKVLRFAETQIRANIFCRGSIEPAYYLLGSDYRGGGGDAYTLSYMAQMGGAAILDYALRGINDAPTSLLRLGYQSFLSSWALINSGTERSNHGYWFPGTGNDGSAGGGFEPAAWGKTWLDQPHHRGSWYYACEIDLGFCGALRGAATIVLDDAVFGRLCLGGSYRSESGRVSVLPQDGVRQRFFARLTDRAFGLVLSGTRFSAADPITFDPHEVRFAVESTNPTPCRATIAVSGFASGRYRIARDNGWSEPLDIPANPVKIVLPAGTGGYAIRPERA